MMPETKFSFKKMSRCSSRKEPRMGRGKRRDYRVNKGRKGKGCKKER